MTMRLRQDDPEADWTVPGVHDVGAGLFRIPLPLPQDGLRAVNVYAVRDGDGLVLVDSGWAITEARDLLEQAVKLLDGSLANVRRFLVTHIHRDHYTLAVALRREFGMRIALGRGEAGTLRVAQDPDADPWAPMLAQLHRGGADDLWTRRGRTFGELDLLSRCLAVTETMAHLEVLVLAGRLPRSEVDGVAHYTRT